MPGCASVRRRRGLRASPMRRQVVALAQQEARGLRHDYVGTEHILLGLLAAREGNAARALEALGLTPDRVRTRLFQILEREVQPSPATCARSWTDSRPPAGSLRLTPRVKKGFALSYREADRLGDHEVDTAHLLLGLLHEGEGFAAHILVELGADPDRVREQLTRLGEG
jgi:ATP-dependent Clp protease ATP-binding subunit ClpC